eukprot:CAMPEP_0172715600 /NCGR_PEP_ID=MMETSP1074-20121228/67639_1 /TAXON_ID=2916 /ORGANISM="Ceratium fusus, Strain PA161109" /LENGTH=329 /DNA_ID=CAMNT_0013540193 /DNA_START=56 /DNA_END=1046 /DNA_ORIENTATION=+
MQADAHRSPSGDPGCDGRPLPPVQHFEDFLARAFARIQDELVGEYGRLLADLQDENEDLRRRLEALQDSGGVKPEYDTDDVARISPTAEDFPEQEVDCESEGAERCQKYYDDMGREDGRQSGDAADVSGDGLRDHRKLRAAEGREPHGGGGSRQDRRHDSHHDDQSRSYRNSGGGSSHAGPRSHGGKQHVDINEYSRSDERQESSRRDRYGSRERQGMSHQVMNEPVDYGGLGREQQPEYRKAEVRGREGHHCHTAGAATSRRSRGGLGIPLTTLIAKVAATVPGEPQSVAEAAAKGDIIVVRLALPPTLARGMVGKAVERASFASSMS